MVLGMMPSNYHHFYVLSRDMVIELTWPPPPPRPGGPLRRIAGVLFGPDRRQFPEHAVDSRDFDAAADLLAADVEAACAAFADLGYRVSVDSAPELRMAA